MNLAPDVFPNVVGYRFPIRQSLVGWELVSKDLDTFLRPFFNSSSKLPLSCIGNYLGADLVRISIPDTNYRSLPPGPSPDIQLILPMAILSNPPR